MRVYGTIEDAGTEKPLSGANITLSLGDTVLIENTPSRDGLFNFAFDDSLLPEEGEMLTCIIEKNGYRSQTLSHKIVDESAQFDVELIPMRVVKWPRILFIAGIILAVSVVLALFGLGVYSLFFGPEAPAPGIKSFTVTPGRAAAGQAVLLQWETRDAAAVYLEDEPVDPVGSKEVKPRETTVYTLKVAGKKQKPRVSPVWKANWRNKAN